MRKLEIAIVAAALVLLSVTATLYIVNHPLRARRDSVVDFSEPKEQQVLLPSELLQKRSTDSDQTQSANEDTSASVITPVTKVIYPDWKSGKAHISGVRAVSENGDFIAPLWSPLGLDIAFTKRDYKGIFLSGPNGKTSTMLLDDPKMGQEFAWNADGMSLQAREPNGEWIDLMITGEKYPVQRRVERAFERDGSIYVQREGGDALRISGSHDRFANPRMSPDEALVVYESRETGLYIASTDGLKTISIGKGYDPTWLPDSSGIVFDLPVSDGTNIVDGDLWYASVEGRERTNLTNSPGRVETHPCVARDGEQIAFSSEGSIFVGRFSR